MPRLLSAAVLVRPESNRLLLGHATGTRRWDLPKGLIEPPEWPLAAARRELFEETGLQLDSSSWDDLGQHAYNSSKDLWLFRTEVLNIDFDLSTLFCSSTFIDRFGRVRPEFDRFIVIGREQLESHCAPSMTRLLRTIEW
jgi:8-oxo-dGTP pyrophosphatase MutT (NUDIX family)